MKISVVSESSILPYVKNPKLGNFGKFPFTSNFGISCNLRFKNEKKELSQKFKDYLYCKTIFCHNLALNLQCTNFFIWKENIASFSWDVEFCVFHGSSSFKICGARD